MENKNGVTTTGKNSLRWRDLMEKYHSFLALLTLKPKHFALLVSAIVAMVIAWETNIFLSSKKPGIDGRRILIATRDLSEGELITFADFKTIAEEDLSLKMRKARVVTDQQLALVEGQRLIKDITSGTPLLLEAVYPPDATLFSKDIPKGLRAYFVETVTLEMVRPGVKVDLVLKPIRENKDSLILVENALVLSLDKREESSGVVVALSPEEIEWIERNSRLGKIVLAIRNPGEISGRGALKKGKQGAKKRVTVEMITEGI